MHLIYLFKRYVVGHMTSRYKSLNKYNQNRKQFGRKKSAKTDTRLTNVEPTLKITQTLYKFPLMDRFINVLHALIS